MYTREERCAGAPGSKPGGEPLPHYTTQRSLKGILGIGVAGHVLDYVLVSLCRNLNG